MRYINFIWWLFDGDFAKNTQPNNNTQLACATLEREFHNTNDVSVKDDFNLNFFSRQTTEPIHIQSNRFALRTKENSAMEWVTICI